MKFIVILYVIITIIACNKDSDKIICYNDRDVKIRIDIPYGGKVIGVDVDQRSKIGERCLTSAMKGLPSAINNALDSYFSGNFSELGGTAQQLGLKDGDYIGLPTDSESWGFTTFTQDQYETVLAGIRDGSIEISSDTENQPEVGSHVTVDYIS